MRATHRCWHSGAVPADPERLVDPARGDADRRDLDAVAAAPIASRRIWGGDRDHICAVLARSHRRVAVHRAPRRPQWAQSPVALSLLVTALLVAVLPIPESAVPLAILTIITLGGPSTGLTIPSMSAIADTADRLGVPIALATVVINLSWAVGETVGAPTAATLSHLTSDTVAFLLIAVAMLATFVVVFTTHLVRSTPSAGVDGSSQLADDEAQDSTSSCECVPAMGG